MNFCIIFLWFINQSDLHEIIIFSDVHNDNKSARVEVEDKVEVEPDWSETLESTSFK